MGIDRKVGRLIFAGIMAASVLVPGYGRPASAQEVEPGAIYSQDCPPGKGGFGELRIDWTGPFPYDVTVITPVERVQIKRGENNNRLYDLSLVRYNPSEVAPTVEFYLQMGKDASEAEKRRKLLQTFYTPTACSTD